MLAIDMLITDVLTNATLMEYYMREDININMFLLNTDEYTVVNVTQDDLEELEDIMMASEHFITYSTSHHGYKPRNYLSMPNIDKFMAILAGGYILPHSFVDDFYKYLVIWHANN